MLQFFRKHQKFFFIFTTIIIVFSFVFYGTYQAIAPAFHRKEKDELLFRTKDGTKIYKSYFTTMERFLDSENWMVSQRPTAANFLNDGVVLKDFLESGLAPSLLPYLSENFKQEMAEKLAKEKTYVPYAHPFVPQLSAMSIWSLFAPEIPEKLALWKEIQMAHEKKAFEARIALFLAQKKFPPAFLSQVIRYQQREYVSFGQDPRLLREDLGIFGYHNLSDWFGQEFMQQVCRAVIHTAAIAREKGYVVTKQEVFGELLLASQKMYESLREKFDLPVGDGYGLFQLYLRQNGYEEAVVFRIWEDVVLFRKYLASVGSGALIDLLAIQNFYAYAHENLSLELFQIPKEFRFQTLVDLNRFEAYLEAVSEKKSILDLPLEFADLSEIETKAPELVGKKYRLYVAEVNHESLCGKVSVKETWEWENKASNWEILKNEFPELKQKIGDPLEILEKIDSKTRKRIDTFARKQIVRTHPEWSIEALKEKNMEEKEIFLTAMSKNLLPGIRDSIAFEEALNEKGEIVGYTQDQDHFFRILVQEKSDQKHVLTFKEALKAGVLDSYVERFHTADKVNVIVRELASKYLSKEGNLENKEQKALPYRFFEVLEKKTQSDGKLAAQWQIEKKEKTITRAEPTFLSFDAALSLVPNGMSKVLVDPNEGAYYYQLLDRKLNSTLPLDKVAQSQEILSMEVRRNFFENLLKEISKG